MRQASCTVDGCPNAFLAKGLCRKHYAQQSRSRADGPRCSLDDCDESRYAKGLCHLHYSRQRLTGSTDRPDVCNKGHDLTPENAYVNPRTGKRRCRICLAEWKRTRKAPACSLDECGDPALALTYCRRHYKAFKAHGDPLGPPPGDRYQPGENWLPVPGWDGLYEVSDVGRVWSIRSRRLLKLKVGSHGYLEVGLCRGKRNQVTKPVHRIEAAAFLGPKPRGQGVRHRDGNQLNNALGNLCYGTQKQNMLDAIEHGTHSGRRRAAEVAERPECVNGHEYKPGSFYFNRAGSKICRACDNEKAERYRLRSMTA